MPSKFIGYRNNVPGAIVKLMSVLYSPYTAENLVKIGPVVAETFDEICRFVLSHPKRCSFNPRNLFTKVAWDVAKIV